MFCGDTIFSGGCGRVFEGTFEQMNHSLEKLMSLPSKTEIYCAHEYTLSNLQFALMAEPDNVDLKEYELNSKNKREKYSYNSNNIRSGTANKSISKSCRN